MKAATGVPAAEAATSAAERRTCVVLHRFPKVLQLRVAFQCNLPTVRRVYFVGAGRRRVARSRAVFGREQHEQVCSHRKMPIARCECEQSSQYSRPAPEGTCELMHTYVLCCIFLHHTFVITQQVYTALGLPEIFLPPTKVRAHIAESCDASTNQSRDGQHATCSLQLGSGGGGGRGRVRRVCCSARTHLCSPCVRIMNR